MSYDGSLYFVGTSKSDGVMAAPAEANAADALWLVLLVHVCQQAVQLQQLRTLGVLVFPCHELAPVSFWSNLHLVIPGIAVKYVGKKHKESLLS